MSRCTIDHPPSAVIQKLIEQQAFLPVDLVEGCKVFLSTSLDQETLNEVFHLLKKYDLAVEDERSERNEKMWGLIG